MRYPITCANLFKPLVAKKTQELQHPTVFIIDDDQSQREVLSRLLSSADYHVELFTSAREFLSRQRFDGCGCILLDIMMPDISGQELQQELENLDNTLPIIFVTGHQDIATCVQVMKKGALDFLTKPVERQALLSAVSSAIEKHVGKRRERVERTAARERLATLTVRERDVMMLVIAGRLNKQIGAALGISESTVKIHRAHLMLKLRAKAVVELACLVQCSETP